MAFPTIAGLNRRHLGDDLTAADGTAVASWADKSIANSPMVQGVGANQPLIKKTTNGINGHTAVLFDGVSDYLENTTLPTGNNASWTRAVVVKLTSGNIAAGGYLIGAVRDYPNPLSLLIAPGGQLRVNYTGSGIIGTSVSSLTVGAHVITMTYDTAGGAFTVRADGTTVLTGSGPLGDVSAGVALASEAPSSGMPSGTGFLPGLVGEFCSWDSVLTTGSLSSWHSYVQDTYAITVADYAVPLTVVLSAVPSSAYVGRAVALTATATGGSGAKTYAASIVSGPSTNNAQFSSVTIYNPVFTPAAAGTYVVRIAASDASGTQSDQVTITVAAPSVSNPAYLSNIVVGTFTAIGSPASVAAGLSDASDSTGVRSVNNPTNALISGEMHVPKPSNSGDPITVTCRLRANSATTASATLALFEGATQRGATKTIASAAAVPTTYTVTFTAAEWAPIAASSWGTDLVQIQVKVTGA